jgi:hypothetical protein
LSYDFSAKNQCKNLKKIVATSSYGKEWVTYFKKLLASFGINGYAKGMFLF